MNFEPLNSLSLAHYWVRIRPGREEILARLRNVEYFLIYSSQVFFICLRRLGFGFVGGYPHHVTTPHPTLINWKVAFLRFYLA